MFPLHRISALARHQIPFAVGSFAEIGPLSQADFPHRHSFFELACVTGGSGSHVVDLDEYPLRPPQLWVIVPGQVHYWKQVHDLSGFLILFNADFLLAYPADRSLIESLSTRAGAQIDDSEFLPLIEEMEREYRRGAPGVATVLQSYVHILLVRAMRLPGIEPQAKPLGRSAETAQRFQRLIAADPKQPMSGYAAELGVSVDYLNETLRGVTGHTGPQLIRQTLAQEAKRLLAQTDHSVAQIGRELGFADPAYFCRFFRREAGMSPGDFRAHWENHHDHLIGSIDRSECGS